MQVVKNLLDPAELTIESPFDDPRYKALTDEIAVLEEQLKQAEKPTPSIAERVRDLLAGVARPQGESAELSLEEQSTLALALAIQELKEKRTLAKGEIDFELCQKYAPIEADGHRNAQAAALALYQALQSHRVLRGRLMSAGININESAMPIHLFPDAAALGSPDQAGTPLWRYIQWLVDKEMIK